MNRVLLGVAAACAAVQIASATWIVNDFETPNVSLEIAEHMIATGEYATAPLIDDALPPADRAPARAYQLPGEPLLLLAGLRLPPALRRYLHVPVVVLFVVGVTAVALTIGGPRLAAFSGVIAIADPFVVVHGPVWDDTFLAAGFEWLVLALIVAALAAESNGGGVARRLIVALAAGAAAITRSHSQVLMMLVALIAIMRRRFVAARATGVAVALGVIVAAGGWGWRNHQTVGAFVIGSTHDGKTFFESIYATARGAILANGAAMYFEPGLVPPQFFVTHTTEVEANAFFTAEAWRYIREHPLDVATTAALKTTVSVTGIDFGRPLTSLRNLGSVSANLVLWALAIAGVFAWRRDPASQSAAGQFVTAAGLTMTATTFALLAAGPVGLRYRISLAGFLYLAAAFALHSRGRIQTAAISARM